MYNNYFWSFPKGYLWIDLSQWLIGEAQKSFPLQEFRQGNMQDIEKIIWDKSFENIFLIASFHHLDTIEQRISVLSQVRNALVKWGKVYMTNWALESSINKEKYKWNYIKDSENKFGSKDFNIHFGQNDRYYHCFSLRELEYLASESNLKVVENRLFDTEKNSITILEK